ncbi:C-type lectin domain family 12 member B [Manis javanica]|nr:C-type lectin domain family 12 member B [Manis javanica]
MSVPNIEGKNHKCNPCSQMWQWYQNSCYYFATNEEKTWTNSRTNCTEKNSTLVKIDSSEEKDFLKSRRLSESSFFLLGLSWDPTGKSWLWDDGSIPSPSLFSVKEYAQINGSKRCLSSKRKYLYLLLQF